MKICQGCLGTEGQDLHRNYRTKPEQNPKKRGCEKHGNGEKMSDRVAWIHRQPLQEFKERMKMKILSR